MKSILTLIFLIPILLFSQEIDVSNDSLVDFPDKEAVFPGGNKAMKQFLAKNVEYPSISMKNGDQGRIFIEFVVNTDGSISDVKILRGVSKELDKESLRVVSMMPNWIPAESNDEKVRARCRIPINFILDTSEDEPEKKANE